ncbi:MAG: hypothetical protein ACE5HS_15505 [bacterium]
MWEIGLTLGDQVWSFLLVYIFIKGYQGKGAPAGFRFGLLIGIFFCSPIIFGFFPLKAITQAAPEISDAIIPGIIPSAAALHWYILSIIKITICGVLASIIYKN